MVRVVLVVRPGPRVALVVRAERQRLIGPARPVARAGTMPVGCARVPA